MRASQPIWRAIVWTERFLPTPAPVTPQARRSPNRVWLAVLPIIAGALVLFVRKSDVWVGIWPLWRVWIEDAVLLLAVAALEAAVVAGIVTWRRERRNHA